MGGYVDGRSSHPLWSIWHQMIRRCHDPRAINYHLYGARGISVYQEWRDSFWAFADAVGERPPGKTPGGRSLYCLDRVDNGKGYEPGNVRWATFSENLANRRRNLKTHCPQGHEYATTGVIDEQGYRRCSRCKREKNAAYMRRRRAKK